METRSLDERNQEFREIVDSVFVALKLTRVETELHPYYAEDYPIKDSPSYCILNGRIQLSVYATFHGTHTNFWTIYSSNTSQKYFPVVTTIEDLQKQLAWALSMAEGRFPKGADPFDSVIHGKRPVQATIGLL